jgi:hypothetical protein
MCNHWSPVDYSLVKNYKFVSIKASKKNELALTCTYQASEETSSSLLLHNRHNYPWNALTNPALLMCLHKIQLLQKKNARSLSSYQYTLGYCNLPCQYFLLKISCTLWPLNGISKWGRWMPPKTLLSSAVPVLTSCIHSSIQELTD